MWTLYTENNLFFSVHQPQQWWRRSNKWQNVTPWQSYTSKSERCYGHWGIGVAKNCHTSFPSCYSVLSGTTRLRCALLNFTSMGFIVLMWSECWVSDCKLFENQVLMWMYCCCQVGEMVLLLKDWPRLLPDQALELLDYAYAEPAVRSYAIECLMPMRFGKSILFSLNPKILCSMLCRNFESSYTAMSMFHQWWKKEQLKVSY